MFAAHRANAGLMHSVAITSLLAAVTAGEARAANLSPATQWQPLVLDVAGPLASEVDDAPNPFLDIRFDVTYTSPSGAIHVVPGFFAGNGRGHGTGNIWRTRFTPDEPGTWSWSVSFLSATDIAVADVAPGATAATTLAASPINEHGNSGEVVVAEADPTAAGLLATGRLEHVGGHYLAQADGSVWIKGGISSPDNFLGFAGFDNTIDQPGGVPTSDLVDGVHQYEPHIDDWQPGDPEFISATTGISSRGIIGAINYLSAQGVNSIRFLPMNLGGAGQETYPFIATSGSDFDNTHYDVSKLQQWNQVLNHMQERGIAAHIVLGGPEADNRRWLDEGGSGVQRKLFLRELVARFGYLNAIKWTLPGRGDADSARELDTAAWLRTLDSAAHPVAVQADEENPGERYAPLLGSRDVDASSIRLATGDAGLITATWRERTRATGVPWVIDLDQVGPDDIGLTDDNTDALRRELLYPVYFSGGNIEWYFGQHPWPLGGNLETENFRTRESMYRYMRVAREFLQDHLPLNGAAPLDRAWTGGTGQEQLFGVMDEVMVAWIPDGRGDRTIEVDGTGAWEVQWFDPLTGSAFGEPRTLQGPTLALGSSPGDERSDWFLKLERTDEFVPAAAVAVPGEGEEEGAAEAATGTIELAEVTEPVTEPVIDTGGEEQPLANDGGGTTGLATLLLLLLQTSVRWQRARRVAPAANGRANSP